jgi:hypothetical protein
MSSGDHAPTNRIRFAMPTRYARRFKSAPGIAFRARAPDYGKREVRVVRRKTRQHANYALKAFARRHMANRDDQWFVGGAPSSDQPARSRPDRRRWERVTARAARFSATVITRVARRMLQSTTAERTR